MTKRKINFIWALGNAVALAWLIAFAVTEKRWMETAMFITIIVVNLLCSVLNRNLKNRESGDRD